MREKINDYDFMRQPSILIEGAFDAEVDVLLGSLRQSECVPIGCWRFVTGFLGENNVPAIVVKTYQGMTNAAAATAMGLAFFSPKAVVSQGIAGGHDPSLHLGDIVVGTHVVPFGARYWEPAAAGDGIRADAFRDLPQEVCCMPTVPLQGRVAISESDAPQPERVFEFPCEPRLVEAAKKAHTSRRVVEGVIGSADEWNNQPDRIALIRSRYQTATEDMETAAAAQVCYCFGIPFLGVRIISNSAVTGEKFDESVVADCQRFVMECVGRIA